MPLKDEKRSELFNVIVDGKVQYKLKLDTTKRPYNFAENLPSGKLTIECLKSPSIIKSIKEAL